MLKENFNKQNNKNIKFYLFFLNNNKNFIDPSSN